MHTLKVLLAVVGTTVGLAHPAGAESGALVLVGDDHARTMACAEGEWVHWTFRVIKFGGELTGNPTLEVVDGHGNTYVSEGVIGEIAIDFHVTTSSHTIVSAVAFGFDRGELRLVGCECQPGGTTTTTTTTTSSTTSTTLAAGGGEVTTTTTVPPTTTTLAAASPSTTRPRPEGDLADPPLEAEGWSDALPALAGLGLATLASLMVMAIARKER